MMGAPLSGRLAGRLWGSAAALVVLCVGIDAAIAPAAADKVGVAAAVNPDAFSSLAGSPQSQINIGKSIFFNERINTTGNGLVQVLLVDGSTFTVGPGSDLVIDKFVYDPKKGTGQIAASFSKGVMRFVGGKISKGDDSVAIKTPAGALAVRGCIILSKVTPSSFAAIMVYGEYMRLGSHNVWAGGNGIFTGPNGQLLVREATTADIGGIMAGLTNGNTNGLNTPAGNTSDPNADLKKAAYADQTAASLINDATQTQIVDTVNSQEPKGGTTPPETVTLPNSLALRVLSSPDLYVADKRSFWSPGVFVVDPGAHGIVGGDDIPIPCFLSPAVCDGSHRGFFQVQTDDYNVNTTLTQDPTLGTRMTGTIDPLIRRNFQDTWPFITYDKTTGQENFNFPIFNVVGVHAVTDAVAIDAQGNQITLSGSAFTGRGGGFFAYQLFQVEDVEGVATTNFNKPVLAFGGTTFTPPPDQPDQLRLFNLFTDPRQGIPAPFAAAETSPTNFSGATIQPLYLLEHTGTEANPGRSVWLQTSFQIIGQGTDQQSILVLALGEQDPDTGQLTGLRRGMSYIPTAFIDDDNNPDTPSLAFKQPINLTGSIATLAGPVDSNGKTPYLFGDTIPHFVIGADSTGNGHNIFKDEPLYPGAFGDFSASSDTGTHGLSYGPSVDGPNNYSYGPPSEFLGASYHIGEQASQANASTVTPVTTGEDVDLYGYAAGIYQQTSTNPENDDNEVGMLVNTSAGDVHLKFKDDNRVSALFNLSGAGDHGGGGASLAFGDWGNAHGRSTVINGNIYAAVESATQRSTVLVEYGDGENHATRTADASLYLVSSGLLGKTGNVQLCTNCDFIKWGTWGGQLQFQDGAPHSGSQVTADINLGWYVVGEITTDTQLDSYATWLATGPSATYQGTAIGNVANNIDGMGWKTYVATGDLAMNWDFSNRTGDLAISHFDTSLTPGGLSFSGDLCAPGVSCAVDALHPAGNHFAGPLSGALPSSLVSPDNVALTGSAVGSFVNNGPTVAAGVIGNWNAHNDVYGVTGIFGGVRH